MLPPNFILFTAVFLFSVCTCSGAQEPLPDSCTPETHPNADDQEPDDKPSHRSRENGFWQHFQFSGGQMTLPFKIRPKADTRSFRLTTDVTIGAYAGLTKRLSEKKEISLTIPLAAGLTFINLNDGNTSFDLALQEAEVIPGLTWCTGFILQVESYSIGLLFGKDYASEIGDQWQYHRRLWWSFGIGFNFVGGNQ